ncbi:MAG: sporulation protein [Ectobacillus sp.]
MFNHIMAKLGKNGAEIKLQLPKDDYAPGEQISAKVVVKGGKIKQTINQITVDFVRGLSSAVAGEKQVIDSIPLVRTKFSIAEREEKTIPFIYTIPAALDWDEDESEFYFIANLDIEAAIDDHERRKIVISPAAAN